MELYQQNKDISQTLTNVGQHISDQTICNQVQIYSGKPKELSSWLSQIEKSVFLAMGETDCTVCRRIAYKRSTKTVSDYIEVNLRKQADQPWQAFKGEMKKRFGEHLDLQTLVLRLRAITQRPQQSLQVFAEVINSKAAEIYKGDVNTAFAQSELVSIFAKGMRSKAVARRLLERNPASLSEAAAIATTLSEQQNRLAAHGLTDEPMEVDEVRQSTKAIKKPRTSPKGKPGYEYKWQDNKPVCYKCSIPGHMGRDCRVNLAKRSGQKSVNELDAQVN